MEDFYRMLDIEEKLDSTQIEEYLRSLNREFRQRTNHRDAKIREDALAKLQLINRAVAVLGTGGDRASYDRELAGFRAEQELNQPLADVDFYQILQLARDATPTQIQQALEDAEATLGAVETTDEPSVRQQKLITLARHTLLDPERRVAYDKALQEKQAFAAQRDASKPVPLKVNGLEVEAWASLEDALELHSAHGFALFQDGEIEAWLRWSQNQRQRANWVRDLAEQSKQSATPVMEYEEFLRLLDASRPFRLYTKGAAPTTSPKAIITQVANLVEVSEQYWNDLFNQFDYILDWIRFHSESNIFEKFSSYPTSDDINIQLERLLFCIQPDLPSPELVMKGTDKGVLDFGTIQSWNSVMREIELTQKGRGYLYGSITVSAPWIVVTPATFAGAATKLTVKVNTMSIKQGQAHDGQIILSALDGRVDPVTIPVHIQQRSLFQSVKSLFGKG